MRTVHIQGTIDVMSAADKRADAKVYHQISFLVAGGREVRLNNVVVENSVDQEIMLGMCGEFVLQKGLFSNRIQSVKALRCA